MNNCEHTVTTEPLCDKCMGSGEGYHPNTTCRTCSGRSVYGVVCEDCGEDVQHEEDL